ncbi:MULTISPECIES: DUF551 domain-containing protein [Ralstonia]|jgi:hypothetical protein|uniref:Uncharacterized protein n=2 Tax=Ralstonia pickettii TaxID=329 RepID=R0E9D3_RALPI|nr:hypothetical protein [Ralstonia pickettii]ENZ78027.1 hypothetical protein OR214_02303 [Ralstonia pickettii OR214]MCM3581886.1 DUF551 domain-containing protein [Ralstonia pickettii]
MLTEELKAAVYDAVMKAAEAVGPDVVIKALCPNHLADFRRHAESSLVGVASSMPGTSGFTMACFEAEKVPVGSCLYSRPVMDAGEVDENSVDSLLDSVPEVAVAERLVRESDGTASKQVEAAFRAIAMTALSRTPSAENIRQQALRDAKRVIEALAGSKWVTLEAAGECADAIDKLAPQASEAKAGEEIFVCVPNSDAIKLVLEPSGTASPRFAVNLPAHAVEPPREFRMIPVTERLPIYDETAKVIGFTKDHDYGGVQFHHMKVAEFYEYNPDDGEPGSDLARKVTHWMSEPWPMASDAGPGQAARSQHAAVLQIIHEEAGRTLSSDDFDLCKRIAKRVAALGSRAGNPSPAVDWRFLANEWADVATNGLQWLRNIVENASQPAQALANMETCVKSVMKLQEGLPETAHLEHLSSEVIKAIPKQTTITLRQTEALLGFFGGFDSEVAIARYMDGLIAWGVDYPEQGGLFLGPTAVDDALAMHGRQPTPMPQVALN